MKWRIAKKIRKAIGTPRQLAYTGAQLDRALNRYDRLKSSRLDKECWHALMAGLGAAGRAKMVAKKEPGAALRMLVETPEDQWRGDWRPWNEFIRRLASTPQF